jgi:hypothetical protein
MPARTRKDVRQESTDPIMVPIGAPTASAMLLPLNTMAIALPTECAGTILATYGAMLDQSRPWATPPRSRAAMARVRLGLAASSTLLSAKASTVTISRVLRGIRPPSSLDRGSAVMTMTAA